ncbi:MAG TPA: response regulator [Stellaceae bacterium]|nr:response regulator [Stellaceae bacterium]
MAKRKAILVVDDDPGVLRAVERLLRALGFEPDTYESIEDFRARADLSNAICLVLDIHLNHVSGIELARQLKASGSLLPIIFITADDSAPIRKMARDVGCIAYLAKPFTAKSLTRAIDKVLIQPTPPNGRGPFI